MEKKAKFIGAYHRGWQHTDLTYEYRGHFYVITKDNNGYMGESLRVQHEKAQKDIDERIEAKDKPIPEWKYEGSAQEAFDMFWNYVEGDGIEE